MPEQYGDSSMIISRQGASPSDFGFDTESDLETFLRRLREQASSLVVEHCNRIFGLVENEIDVVEGTGRQSITTRNYPVVEIHEITVGSSTLDESQYQLVSTRGRPDRNSGRIERRRRRWPPGRDVTITYDWGFEEVPAVVNRVVEDMVVGALERARVDRQSDGKQSESMDGYSVSWDNSDIGDYLTLTESMKERLRPLRQRGRA